MQCECGNTFNNPWACKKCLNAFYCSPSCRKADLLVHKPLCEQLCINKRLDTLAKALESSKPLAKYLTHMLSRSKYLLNLSATELRMVSESPIKNMNLIKQKLTILGPNDENDIEYIVIQCLSNQKNVKINSV